jgi:hypothetical protein
MVRRKSRLDLDMIEIPSMMNNRRFSPWHLSDVTVNPRNPCDTTGQQQAQRLAKQAGVTMQPGRLHGASRLKRSTADPHAFPRNYS